MSRHFYTPWQLETFPHLVLRHLKVVRQGHILRITLARPEKRNALNPLMTDELVLALEYAGFEPSVRCVIIDAEGPVFCAGADLNSFLTREEEAIRKIPVPRQPVNLGDAFASLHKPSIAQIEGPVLAGGFLILCGVTFAVSVPEAHFSLPEVRRGLWPMQVMASLSRVVPPRKVLEMCITAKQYNTEDALATGLISRVSDRESIGTSVQELAIEIAEKAPLAVSKGMQAFYSLLSGEKKSYAELQDELNLLLKSEDAAEGISAFREKRKPTWKNR